MTSVVIKLGHAMAARGIEQQELARAAGCSQVTISKILSGLIKHSRFLPEIAAVLGVDFEWLRGERGYRPDLETGRMMLMLPHEQDLQILFRGLIAQAPSNASPDRLARFLARHLPAGLAAMTRASGSADAAFAGECRLGEADYCEKVTSFE